MLLIIKGLRQDCIDICKHANNQGLFHMPSCEHQAFFDVDASPRITVFPKSLMRNSLHGIVPGGGKNCN